MPDRPRFRDGRALKRWRYVGVYGPELMACFGAVSIGGLPQAFWAVWDREARRLHERTRFRPSAVRVDGGRVRVRDRGVAIDLVFDERGGTPLEVGSLHEGGEIWTRKRAGLRFAGSVVIDGRERRLDAAGIVDDSAGWFARRTRWAWSAGVGHSVEGADLAWNLVSGVHDTGPRTECAIWVDGELRPAPAVRFDEALTAVAAADGSFGLRCAHEAVRERDDNLIVMRSRYEQPFGTFTGTLPGGVALAEGYGVMERHDARW